MQGLRAPTPRGRTESCTLRILTDAFTGAHGKKGRVPSARGAGGGALDNGRLENGIYRGHGPPRPWSTLYCGRLEDGRRNAGATRPHTPRQN